MAKAQRVKKGENFSNRLMISAPYNHLQREERTQIHPFSQRHFLEFYFDAEESISKQVVNSNSQIHESKKYAHNVTESYKSYNKYQFVKAEASSSL